MTKSQEVAGDISAGLHNVLPFDGEALYYRPIFNKPAADAYFEDLLHGVPWKPDEGTMFGKHFITDRKVAWYGDEDFPYTYSHKTRVALPWTPTLHRLKAKVENVSGVTYNSCLLNFYELGDYGMGWHQDNEKELGDEPAIASVSFGAHRRFDFKHKEAQQKISIILEHGSLLVMRGVTQTYWQHQLPKTKKVSGARINLTFRTIIVR